MAAEVARSLGFIVEPYPADWSQYGRAAGPIRNQQMLDSGVQLVLAFHDHIETSKGTQDMLRRAQRAGVATDLIT